MHNSPKNIISFTIKEPDLNYHLFREFYNQISFFLLEKWIISYNSFDFGQLLINNSLLFSPVTAAALITRRTRIQAWTRRPISDQIRGKSWKRKNENKHFFRSTKYLKFNTIHEDGVFANVSEVSVFTKNNFEDTALLKQCHFKNKVAKQNKVEWNRMRKSG